MSKKKVKFWPKVAFMTGIAVIFHAHSWCVREAPSVCNVENGGIKRSPIEMIRVGWRRWERRMG
jgi:hypothetical protein